MCGRLQWSQEGPTRTEVVENPWKFKWLEIWTQRIQVLLVILDTRLNAISNEKQTRSFWCHFFIESFWLPLEKSHACSSQLISSHCVFLNTTWTCAFKNAGANAISDPLKCGETFIKIYRFCRKKMSTRYGSPIKNWPYGVKLPLWVELFYPTYNDWLGAHLDPLILQEPVLKVLIEAEGGKSTGNISAKCGSQLGQSTVN